MLSSLFIQNFALIDSIEIDFDSGLTVITGETGAGKSILLGALSLILGKRADHSSLHDQSRKCIVEGVFDIRNYELGSFFEDNDLDYQDKTILRREISAAGKSRSFINDTPVTLEVLRMLGIRLVDIHSQHQSLQINDLEFQLDVIDSIASNKVQRQLYSELYASYRKKENELLALKQKASEGKRQSDYLDFQFNELESLGLKLGEAAELEAEQRRFANSEEILLNLNQLNQAFREGEGNLLSQMQRIKQLLDLNGDYPELLALKERFDSVFIEVQDISNEIESQPNNFQYDAEKHQLIEERLSEIHRLQMKHQLADADELLQLFDELNAQLESISNYDAEISRLEQEVDGLKSKLIAMAEELSEKRIDVLSGLESQVKQLLAELGMLHAQLKVKHHKYHEINKSGLDEFNFLFSANKGVAPQPIAKAASGGEISRFMLSIKTIVAQHQQMPTILFDEIDTGVSGEVAEKMGAILAQIGVQRQVISITHLPQIAAKGGDHLYVFKEEGTDSSKTKMKKLSAEQRVEELAKMLSGKSLTEAAINNAKELLAQ